MKRAVWKFAVVGTSFKHLVPEGARFLAVQVQDGSPQMWLLVDPERPRVKMNFRVVATGEEFEAGAVAEYLGTFQVEWTVWHLFKS